MLKIQPCIWFDVEAEEAANLYTSAFPDSRIDAVVRYGKSGAAGSGRPEGSVMSVEFELAGVPFIGINGGTYFRPNPAISFFVRCESEAEVDRLWARLAQKTLMEVGRYPYAERYGWCEDKYGVSWQLIYNAGAPPPAQKINPSLLLVGKRFGKAEEAIRRYVSLFPRSEVGMTAKNDQDGTVMYGEFKLDGQTFVAMESAAQHDFDFTPGLSLMIRCESQAEVDHYWSALSAVPEAEQCGWLQDQYGVSWQLIHKDWGRMLAEAGPAGQDRLMAAILSMKKPDLARLEAARSGGNP